jgi:hypothetical protein
MNAAFKGVGLHSQFDVEQYRLKLEAMSDSELRKEGRTLADLCRPQKSPYLQPNKQWVIQLEECRTAWRKRHPRPASAPQV